MSTRAEFFQSMYPGLSNGEVIDEVYLFQKYLESHSITLMADDQKLPCICID